jgi:tRNA(fMet)-specific endonuclease VapC
MERYLLDTNILSELERNPRGSVFQRISQVGQHRICTSIIVAAEIRYGVAKKGSARLAHNLGMILGSLNIIPFESPADQIYGNLRLSLERAGKPIGPNDLLIASQALALGYTLVTDNVKEFARVESLRLQNWIR